MRRGAGGKIATKNQQLIWVAGVYFQWLAWAFADGSLAIGLERVGWARRALTMYPPRCDKISPRLKITLSARYRNNKQPNERPRSDTSGSIARQKGTAALRAIVFMSWRRHSYKDRGRRGATAGGSETRPYGRKAMTKATELREAFLKPRSKPPIRSLASPGNSPACSAGRLQRQELLGGAAELLQFLLGARLDVIAAWRAVRCVRRQKF